MSEGITTTTVSEGVITVPYEEIEGSPTGSVDKDGKPTIVRVYECAWDSYIEFIGQILGRTTVSQTPGGTTSINVILGVKDAEWENLRASAVTGIQGMAAIKNHVPASYEKARITVQFTTDASDKDENKDKQALWTEDFKPTIELMSIPTGSNTRATGLWFVDDNEQMQRVGPGMNQIVVSGGTWSITRKHWAVIPQLLWDCLGAVNKDEVQSAKFNKKFEEGTLLCSPWGAKFEVMPGTAPDLIEVTTNFVYKETGWNRFFIPGSSEPQILFTKKLTGAKPKSGAKWKDLTPEQLEAAYRPYPPATMMGLVNLLRAP